MADYICKICLSALFTKHLLGVWASIAKKKKIPHFHAESAVVEEDIFIGARKDTVKPPGLNFFLS